MSTIRILKDNNFTVMSNHHLRDVNLSLKAKGLLSYLLSLPDDWHIYVSELVKHSADGKESIYSALKELIKNSYVTKQMMYEEKTKKFTGINYTVYESQLYQPLPALPDTALPQTEQKPIKVTRSLSRSVRRIH